ncbi:MAG: vitamin K epoxide reductase family protein, partial [Pseudomonadota bacterium]
MAKAGHKGRPRASKGRQGWSRGDASRGRGERDWVVVGLALLGAGISLYLALVGWLDGGLGLCAEGGGCDRIRGE